MKKEFSLIEKREYIFILEILSCLFGNKNHVDISTDEIDFNHIFEISGKNSIANMVCYGMDKAEIDLPLEIKKRFVYNRKFMLMKDASQFDAQRKLVSAFERNGVDNLPVKGQFIKDTYGQPDFRTMSDMDIHVRVEDFPKIKEILKSMDYTFSVETETLIVANQMPFVQVEIHGDNGEFRDTTFGDNLFSVAKPVDGTEHSYEFSLDDHYIYIIEHYAKHFRDISGMGVRMVCDVYNLNRALKNKIDWEYVDKILKKSGTYKFHKMLISKGEKYFEGVMTEDGFDLVDVFILSNNTFGTHEIKIYTSKKNYIEKYLDNSNKENYLFHRIFPPVMRMEEDYPILKKSKIFLPFTWAHRGIKVLFSKDSKTYRKNIANYRKYNDEREFKYLNEVMKMAGF